MNSNANNDQLMIRYLLDELSEAEQKLFEDRYFADDAWFEELTILEDELIDAYVRDELSEAQRKRFEERFLTAPQRFERVRFARALTNYTVTAAQELSATNETKDVQTIVPSVDQKSASFWLQTLRGLRRGEQPVIQVAFAAVIVTILLGIAWLILKRVVQPVEVVQVEVERLDRQSQNQRNEQSQQENGRPAPAQTSDVPPVVNNQPPTTAPSPLPTNKQPNNRSSQTNKQTSPLSRSPKPSRPNIVTLALVAGSVRDTGESNKLRLTSKVDVVEFKLAFDADDFVRYSAVLQTAEGTAVWSAKNLPAHRLRSGSTSIKQLRVRIPARRLIPNDYIVAVSGITTARTAEVVAEYFLQIEK